MKKDKKIDYVRLNKMFEVIQADISKHDEDLDFLVKAKEFGPASVWISEVIKLEDKRARFTGTELAREPTLGSYFKRLKKSLKEMRRFFEWVMDHIDEHVGSSKFIMKHYRYEISFETRSNFMWEDRFFKGEEGTGFFSNTEVDIIDNKHDELVEKFRIPFGFIETVNALHGAEVSRLKRCVRCNKIFFQPTKRPKHYCTERCRNTAAVNRYRKNKEKKEGES